MVAACRDLCAAMPGLFSVACACYRLRTAICHTLEILAVSRLLAQCRQLVGHFKHSNITSHALSEQQKQEGTQIPLYLVSQVAARWNSKYDMFDRLHKLRVPVTAVLSNASITEAVDQGLNLSPNQWVQVANVSTDLDPFKGVTASFSDSTKVTVSTILPLISGLVEECNENDSDTIFVTN